jgi:hypothetical protein
VDLVFGEIAAMEENAAALATPKRCAIGLRGLAKPMRIRERSKSREAARLGEGREFGFRGRARHAARLAAEHHISEQSIRFEFSTIFLWKENFFAQFLELSLFNG